MGTNQGRFDIHLGQLYEYHPHRLLFRACVVASKVQTGKVFSRSHFSSSGAHPVRHQEVNAAILPCSLYITNATLYCQSAAAKAGHDRRFLKAPEFPPVEEQIDFDWKTTEPVQARPFKPKYHLTMGESLYPLILLSFKFLFTLSSPRGKEELTLCASRI